MMETPKFTDSNPSDQQLRAENDRLIVQADKMLAETGVLDVFARHGEVGKIGGSFRYGLMVYPDLDFGVVADVVRREQFSGLLADLANQSYIRKLQSVAIEPEDNSGSSKYWIGLEIPFEGDNWGLDSWLQLKSAVGKYIDPYLESLNALADEKRDLILRLKYDTIRRGLYGKKYSSVQVYDAVINGEVGTVEDFYTSFEE